MTEDSMPGALLPIGHLTNARAAVQRYTDSGGQLDAGSVSDELDELRRLVVVTAAAVESLMDDARRVGGGAARACIALTHAQHHLHRAVGDMQPALLSLMADVAAKHPGRNAA